MSENRLVIQRLKALVLSAKRALRLATGYEHKIRAKERIKAYGKALEILGVKTDA